MGGGGGNYDAASMLLKANRYPDKFLRLCQAYRSVV